MHASAAAPGNAAIIPVAPLLPLPKLVLPSCWFAPLCLLDIVSTYGSIVAVFFNMTVAAVIICLFGFGEDSWSAYGVKYARAKPGVGTRDSARVSTHVTCDSIRLLGASQSTVRLEYITESLENIISYHLHLRSMPLPYKPGLPTGSCLWMQQMVQ